MLCSAADHAATLSAPLTLPAGACCANAHVLVTRAAVHAMLRRIDRLPICRTNEARSVAAALKAHLAAALCRRERRRPV